MELSHILGEYRNDMVLIGGWVPELLLPNGTEQHVGSMDVDLALNNRNFKEAGYETIQQLLLSRGYETGKQPFIFFRKVQLSGREIHVEVDLLAGEYGGTGKTHRTQKVQDLRPRKVRGCDLAFEIFQEITIDGTLPNGGRDTVSIRVASIVPFFIMKGMALHDRMKEKDAWDIYFCVKNYPGGVEALAKEFLPHMDHTLVREGIDKISAKFASPDHLGPKFVVDFEEVDDREERALKQRDAFERIHTLLQKLSLI